MAEKASKAVKKAEAEPAAKSPTMKLVKKGTPAAAEPAKAAKAAAEAVEKTKAKVAEVAAEKADTTEGETLGEVDQIVQTAHEIENMKEDKAFKLVPSLLDDIDRNCFRLGGILSRINGQGWFMDKGYENFRAYIEAETDVGYRKAMYLIGIYNGLVESGVKWEQVKHLGWTKLKDLAPHLTPENVDEWVAMVDGLTTIQIQELIKQKTAGAKTDESGAETSESAEKVVTMTFKLHADQKQTVREALEKCKHESGTTFDSVALEYIAMNYLGGESKIKGAPSLKEQMKGKSAEEVLELFGEVFPNVELQATLPE